MRKQDEGRNSCYYTQHCSCLALMTVLFPPGPPCSFPSLAEQLKNWVEADTMNNTHSGCVLAKTKTVAASPLITALARGEYS